MGITDRDPAFRQMRAKLGGDFEREFRPRLQALAETESPTDPAERLLAALQAMDQYVAEQTEAHASVPSACAAGCDFCCTSQAIYIDTLEAVLVVRAIAASPKRKDIIAGIMRARPTTNGPGGSPCSMLAKNGLCSVHPSRPSTCRVYISTSRKACKLYAQSRGPRPDTVRGYPYLALDMTRETCVEEAHAMAGLDARQYEINALMRRIWSDPAKVEAWRSGSPTDESDLAILPQTEPRPAPSPGRGFSRLSRLG